MATVAMAALLVTACGSGATPTEDSPPPSDTSSPSPSDTSSTGTLSTDTSSTAPPATDPSSSTDAIEGFWKRQRLDSEPGPDQAMLFESSGDQTIVLVPTEDGRVTPWRSQAGGAFEQGDPVDTGMEYVQLTTAVRTGDGWLALMFEGLTYEVGTLRSPDGLRWTPGTATGFGPAAESRQIVATDDGFVAVGTVRTAGDPDAGGFRPMAWRSAMVIDHEGRVVVLTLAAGGVDAWTWPAGISLPTAPEPDVPVSDVRVLGDGETLPPDRRYGYPLYIHCGMDRLYQINGTAWKRTDDGPDFETGAGQAPPSDWPVCQQTIFGFVTLVEDGLIEYSIGDGQVIATYAPSSSEPPGCR